MTGEERPRLWIKLRRVVSQTAPELWGRTVSHPGGEWIEIRGYVGYPGEVNHSRENAAWSFWESHDIDLSPIFGQEDVERVYVEPGHRHAEQLRRAGDAPFGVVVAEGPPAERAGSR